MFLGSELVAAMDAVGKELSVIVIFWSPTKFFSDLQAKARRFTGRSDLIILSKKMAGKLNLGITLSSYDKIVDDDLQSSMRKLENKTQLQ